MGSGTRQVQTPPVETLSTLGKDSSASTTEPLLYECPVRPSRLSTSVRETGGSRAPTTSASGLQLKTEADALWWTQWTLW